MNRIINEPKENYQPGDLFINKTNGDVFILVANDFTADNEYQVYSLMDGRVWLAGFKTFAEAVEGLEFLGRDFKITISNE